MYKKNCYFAFQPQDIVSVTKNPYKTHHPCSKCGLKSADGWEYEQDGKIICDVCADKLE